jgi:hypothetical protein
VLGDRGTTDGELVGELAHGPRAGGDALEDLAPGGIGERGERSSEASVSHHLP